VELLFAFGGVNGMRGRRNGDIGCEAEPVGRLFQLRAEQCVGNEITVNGSTFEVRGKPGLIGACCSAGAKVLVGNGSHWEAAETLFPSPDVKAKRPVVIGSMGLKAGQEVFIGLQLLGGRSGEVAADVSRRTQQGGERATTDAGGDEEHRDGAAGEKSGAARRWLGSELAGLFARGEAERRALAERVAVETPDPFVNAAAAALNVAADAIWDDRQAAFMHGAVAWRMRLLGWRGPYAGDALGWHDRTAKHFEGFANQQNTGPVSTSLPPPEPSANLSRNETALHSNGDLTRSHYDMNLVGVDAFFRHLLWTGDLEYARRLWPVIERHLAWERRLFRREYGRDKLPLYEGYCCIWASDDLAYNGGGATHATAYNLYHNRMAARVARMLGRDPAPYEREAELIAKAMREHLWLTDRGWFAEWKDSLGLQLVHPTAAVWTFYHTLDSQAATPLEAWQMSRFVDTQIARFPLRGQGVPEGCDTVPTTSWMPYAWSLNNVVLAETMHTALGYWQAGRPESALPLFKGALLDSMYLGLCPGNVGMCTWLDANRRESQRDFGDGIGTISRALVEGLFGIQPDLLEGEIKVRPGFPSDWEHAEMRHPDFRFRFRREGSRETFALETKFNKPLRLRLDLPAFKDEVASVTVNGRPAPWHVVEGGVGRPWIDIAAAAAKQQEIAIVWRGRTPASASAPAARAVPAGAELHLDCGTKVLELADPQHALGVARFEGTLVQGKAVGVPGHRTVFARVEQGALRWWQPLAFQVQPAFAPTASLDWTKPVIGKLEPVDLTPVFNDKVTQIFQNDYLAPRSPFCSLAMPKQGIGSWCHPKETFEVDDAGLRRLAAKSDGKILLPNGVPLTTPGAPAARNIAFVSQWTNYPAETSVALTGRSSHAFLLMAGSTSAMQSRFDNGEVIVTYADGSSARLALHNPTTWWPIDQDYYIDDFAFRLPEPLPVRVDLKTGKIRVLTFPEFQGHGGVIPGGAATVLELPLDSSRELKALTVRALANEVVIGLMSVTLQRPET
jgi:hypothetical protein